MVSERIQQYFQLIAEAVPGALWAYDLSEGRIIMVSASFSDITDADATDVIRDVKDWRLKVCAEEDLEMVRSFNDLCLVEAANVEYRLKNSGRVIRESSSIAENMGTQLVMGHISDVTHLHNLVSSVQAREERVNVLLGVSSDIILCFNDQLELTDFHTGSGFPAERIWFDKAILHCKSQLKKNEEFSEGTFGGKHFQTTARKSSNGEWLVVFKDVSTIHARVATLEETAEKDQLTQAFNRHGLQNRLSFFSESPKFAAALIDCDNFKTINDKLGWAGGDRVLQEIANLLRANVRSSDVIARIGGDEFVVLFNHDSEKHLMDACQRIQQATEKLPFRWDNGAGSVSVSIGAALLEGDAVTTIEALILSTQKALKSSKRSGKNRATISPMPQFT